MYSAIYKLNTTVALIITKEITITILFFLNYYLIYLVFDFHWKSSLC